MDAAGLLYQLCMGVALAACAGLRAFLPLFVLSLAARWDVIPLSESVPWLGSDAAVGIFAVAVIAELAADKIPLVDHALDSVQTLLRPAAGALLAVAVLRDLPPLEATVLGLVAGGSVAGLVHAGKAQGRLVSTGLTGGLANPWISLAEDAAALAGSLAALVVPWLVAALALVLAVWVARRLARRGRLPRG